MDKTNNTTVYKLTREERETHIYIDDITGMCVVDTTIPKDIRKFQKQNWKVTNSTYYSDGTVLSMTFEAPRKYLSVRQADFLEDKPKRIMSEEQKAKMQAGRKRNK